jgi:hypothetical protein
LELKVLEKQVYLVLELLAVEKIVLVPPEEVEIALAQFELVH